MNFEVITGVEIPIISPRMIPPRISVGKCTKRYILEKAIRRAVTAENIPKIRLFLMITADDITEERVCPDGNE